MYIVDTATRQSSLVISKVRVAPVKGLSIPRLELLAAVLGSRLLSSVENAFHGVIQFKHYCWTDSLNTLYWIRQPGHNWKIFIQRRIAEIYQHTAPTDWLKVPGDQNPSDLVTRGISAEVLAQSKVWLRGPSLLKSFEGNVDLFLPDAFVSFPIDISCEMKIPNVIQVANIQPQVIQIESFSCFTRLIYVVAYLYKYIHKLYFAVNKADYVPTLYDCTVKAKIFLHKYVQSMYFSEEISLWVMLSSLTTCVVSYNYF